MSHGWRYANVFGERIEKRRRTCRNQKEIDGKKRNERACGRFGEQIINDFSRTFLHHRSHLVHVPHLLSIHQQATDYCFAIVSSRFSSLQVHDFFSSLQGLHHRRRKRKSHELFGLRTGSLSTSSFSATRIFIASHASNLQKHTDGGG